MYATRETLGAPGLLIKIKALKQLEDWMPSKLFTATKPLGAPIGALNLFTYKQTSLTQFSSWPTNPQVLWIQLLGKGINTISY